MNPDYLQLANSNASASRRGWPRAILILASCAMFATPQAHARDHAGDIAIGVTIGTVLGIAAAKATDSGDPVVSVAPAPFYMPPVVTVPVYYQPAPVYYPPPVYYYYPSAPMPRYPRHYYRR